MQLDITASHVLQSLNTNIPLKHVHDMQYWVRDPIQHCMIATTNRAVILITHTPRPLTMCGVGETSSEPSRPQGTRKWAAQPTLALPVIRNNQAAPAASAWARGEAEGHGHT